MAEVQYLQGGLLLILPRLSQQQGLPGVHGGESRRQEPQAPLQPKLCTLPGRSTEPCTRRDPVCRGRRAV